MSSIYLTSYNSGESIPLFKKKGIGHLMPGNVSTPTVFVNAKNFVFYPIAFLQMAIICIVTKLVTELDSGYTALFKGIKVSKIFNQPICTFRFTTLEPSQITNLKAMGLMQDMTNPNLFTGSPTPDNLATIWAMKPVEDRIRPGHVGSDGFFAWCFLIKGVQAFITARNNTDGRANLRYSLKQSVKFDKEGDILRIGHEIFKGKHGFSSGRSIITTNDIFMHPPALDLSSLPGEYLQLPEAKALPDTATGFVFPYFSGLNTPDKTCAATIFSRMFPNLLGNSYSGHEKIMRQIGSGNRALAFSEAGMALAHIYRVFDISLRLGDVSISLILRGNSYQGMIVLCTPESEITMHGQKYTAGQVNAECRKLDLLESQAEKIVSLLDGAMELDGVVRPKYHASNFLDSRSALTNWNRINRDAFAASDILKQVKEILSKMEFADTYSPLTSANVQKAVRAMVSKEFSGLADCPAYLGATALVDRSPIAEALSMFGPMVPSFNTGLEKNSITITVPASDKTDSNLVRTDGKRPLSYLPFYPTPFTAGVQQWQSVVSKGSFRLPAGRKDKKEFANLHRSVFTVGATDELTVIYNGIKSMCDDARSSAKAGGKRKRDSGDSVQVAKRAKAEDSEVMEGL